MLSLLTFVVGAVVGAAFKDFFKGLTNSWFEKFGFTVRNIGWFAKSSASIKPESFNIGARATSLFVIDGNGNNKYTPKSIRAIYRDGTPDSPDDISDRILEKERQMEIAREQGNNKIWDGIGVGLLNYTVLRDETENNLALNIEFYKSRYAAFQATVATIGSENTNDEDSISYRYLKHLDPRQTIPFLARHVGIVACVVTKDNWLLIAKRTSSTGVRQDEYDVSVVEGIEPTKDADTSGAVTSIDVFGAIRRGCKEEIGFVPTENEISVLGFGLDMSFYQFNFIAVVQSELDLKTMISLRNGRAKDSWETKFKEIPCQLDPVLEFINDNETWGFAVVALYWTLLQKNLKRVVDARAGQIIVDAKPSVKV